jgi:hypothetical protein
MTDHRRVVEVKLTGGEVSRSLGRKSLGRGQ